MLTEKRENKIIPRLCLQHSIIAGYEYEAKGKTNKQKNQFAPL